MSETVCSKPVIAICDDDQSMRQLTERVLIRTGQYAVVTVNSGSGLLEYASNNPLNLVLLDVRLPGEHGFKVCEQLLEIPLRAFLNLNHFYLPGASFKPDYTRNTV